MSNVITPKPATSMLSLQDLEALVQEIDGHVDSETDTSEYVHKTILLKKTEYDTAGLLRKEKEAATKRLFDQEFDRMLIVYDALLKRDGVQVMENPSLFDREERGGINPYYCAKIYCMVGDEKIAISF